MLNKDNMIAMAPLFLVIAIDSMGLGILFPTLNSMIMIPQSHFLPIDTGYIHREFILSLIISLFMFAWFFGAGILGDLSDLIGRKKALVICLAGAVIGYFISGVGIEMHSILLLIVGRLIAGFTAGSQAIAQAAIVDLSSDHHRARNIGYILLVSSIGFVVGPFLGGVLSDKSLLPWFAFSTPLFFACLLSLINLFLLFRFFRESFTVVAHKKIKIMNAVINFLDAFKHASIRNLSLILFIFIAGWSGYFSFISQFLIFRFHYSSMQVALFMTVMAIGFALGFSVVVDYLANRFEIKKCVMLTLFIAGLLTLFTLFNTIESLSWIASTIIGLCVASAYSMLITLFSKQVDETQQGWVMGVTNGIMALAFGITTLFSGFAASLGASLPLIVMIIGMLLASFLTYYLIQNNQHVIHHQSNNTND